MATETVFTKLVCQCDKCEHVWLVKPKHGVPRDCPRCRTIKWNEKEENDIRISYYVKGKNLDELFTEIRKGFDKKFISEAHLITLKTIVDGSKPYGEYKRKEVKVKTNEK